MKRIHEMTEIPNADDFVLVKCPRFSESGYEVAQYMSSKFVSQGNGDDITWLGESWVYLEDIEEMDAL